MTIKEIHDFIDLICDKEQTGYFSHEEKDSALDRASMWMFNEYKRVYASDVDAYEALAPFKDKVDYTTNSVGVYSVNSLLNYVQLLSIDVSVMDTVARRWPVEIVKEDEIASRLNSQLLAPSATEPVAEETNPGTFKIYPEQIHAGTIRFLRRPAKPAFVYTMTGRTVTYDSGTSTQLEWTEPYVNKVIFKAIALLGINLDNNMLQQAGLMLPKSDV